MFLTQSNQQPKREERSDGCGWCGKGLKTGTVIRYTLNCTLRLYEYTVRPVLCQFCASLGLKCLDEQLQINNTVDSAIQYQTISQQWAETWAIWVNGWPLMHNSLCCQADVKTIAGNDVNGDLARQKHCIQGVSWESGWQWIKMSQETMEHNSLTTFTASTRC